MARKMHDKQRRKKECSIRGLLTSFAHTICICVILLGSVSWAWFSEIVNGPSIAVQTASYGINTVVSGNGIVTSGDYCSVIGGDHFVVEVENGVAHDISLSATGSAVNGGYCIVSAGDDLYYTVPIGGQENSDKISFQIWFPGSGSSRIEFMPYWGRYPATLPTKWKEENVPGEGDIIENMGKYVVADGHITVSGADNSQ